MGKFKDFFSSRKKVVKFLSTYFTGFLFAGTLAATAGTCYLAQTNYEKGQDFDHSYNIRYELDLDSVEDPNVEPVKHYTVEEYKKDLEKDAKSYSNYLSKMGVEVTDIYPEVYQEKDGTFKAYINAIVPNQLVKNPHTVDKKDEDKKIDRQMGEVYFEDVYAPRLSIFYNDGASSQTYLISKDDLVDNDKALSLPDDVTKNAINIHMKQSVKDSIYDKFSTYDASSDQQQPFLYVFNDLRGFLNRIQYILQVGKLSEEGNPLFYDIYNYWLSESERKFVEDYYESQGNYKLSPLNNVHKGSEAFISKNNNSDYAPLPKGYILNDWKDEYGKFHNFIEGDEYKDSSNFIDHKGKLKYSFMSKWIVGMATISGDNEHAYKTVFPDNDPNKSSKDSNKEWMVLESPTSSRFDTKLLWEGFASNQFNYPIKDVAESIGEPDGPDSWPYCIAGGKEAIDDPNWNFQTVINKVDSTMKGNVFSNSATLSTVIAIYVIVMLIGLIVTLLYKIPGLFGFGLIGLTTSVTSVCLMLGGYQLTVGLFCGILGAVLIGAFSLFNYFERYKKQVAQSYDMNVATKRTFLSSFWSCFDVHAVGVLAGVAMIYFGPATFLTAGVALIIGTLLSYAFNYFVLNGMMAMLFCNQPMSTFNNLFAWKPKKMIASFKKDFEADKTVNKLTFYGNTPKKIGKHNLNWNAFKNWKFTTFLWLCVAIIVVAGLAIMFTSGVHNSYVFYGGTRVALYVPGDYDLNQFIDALKNNFSDVVWYNISQTGHYFYAYTSTTLEYGKLYAAFGSIGNVMVQSINPDPINMSVANTIRVMLIAAGFITAYSLLRFGWTSIVPIFLGMVAGPILVLCLISAFQIYFDSYIIYAAILVFLINTLLCVNMLANVNNRWYKANVTTPKATLKLVNLQLSSCFKYILYLSFALIITLLVAMLVIPSTIITVFGLTIIGLVVSIFVSIAIAPKLNGLLQTIKYKYKKNITTSALVTKNYDTIDEELIDGVNKIKKNEDYI